MNKCGWIVIKSRRGLIDNIKGYYPERAGKGPFSGSLSRFYYVFELPTSTKAANGISPTFSALACYHKFRELLRILQAISDVLSITPCNHKAKQLHTTHLLPIIAIQQGTSTHAMQHNTFPTKDIRYLMLLHDLCLAFYSLNLSTNESYNFSPSPL